MGDGRGGSGRGGGGLSLGVVVRAEDWGGEGREDRGGEGREDRTGKDGRGGRGHTRIGPRGGARDRCQQSCFEMEVTTARRKQRGRMGMAR